jgi:secondary thiamine-phosphate synthase enzyme
MDALTVSTRNRNQFVDITREVAQAVRARGLRDGACLIYVPHTTCAVTVNENADPDVPADIIAHLSAVIPRRDDFRHGEGNSDAHIKSSLVGCSAMVPVKDGALALGTWQAIFLCEFDGPRTRCVNVQCMAAGAPGA